MAHLLLPLTEIVQSVCRMGFTVLKCTVSSMSSFILLTSYKHQKKRLYTKNIILPTLGRTLVDKCNIVDSAHTLYFLGLASLTRPMAFLSSTWACTFTLYSLSSVKKDSLH